MSLRYECHDCGEEIVVRYLGVGETAQCPHCGAEAPVPGDAEVVDAPSTRTDDGALSPNLPRPGTREVPRPRARRRSHYWFLRILAWVILVLTGLAVAGQLVNLGQTSAFAQDGITVGTMVIVIPLEILFALGTAQAIWALLEIVRNTRAVLPPPADTFD